MAEMGKTILLFATLCIITIKVCPFVKSSPLFLLFMGVVYMTLAYNLFSSRNNLLEGETGRLFKAFTVFGLISFIGYVFFSSMYTIPLTPIVVEVVAGWLSYTVYKKGK